MAAAPVWFAGAAVLLEDALAELLAELLVGDTLGLALPEVVVVKVVGEEVVALPVAGVVKVVSICDSCPFSQNAADECLGRYLLVRVADVVSASALVTVNSSDWARIPVFCGASDSRLIR